MTDLNDGPAFPAPGDSGMTLRDYFAGQVIKGIYSRLGVDEVRHTKRAAYVAYLQANEMLIERQKPHV